MKKYVALALTLAFADSCVQPPLPPEPPITVVISQCRGWQDAGEPVTAADPVPGPRPSEPEESAQNP